MHSFLIGCLLLLAPAAMYSEFWTLWKNDEISTGKLVFQTICYLVTGLIILNGYKLQC
jgi:hypothetical protein